MCGVGGAERLILGGLAGLLVRYGNEGFTGQKIQSGETFTYY